jgi:enoyl-CoA hydratase
VACDWRVIASNAFVSLPEIALGIPLTWGAIPRLTALVGPSRAKRLTILCERLARPRRWPWAWSTMSRRPRGAPGESG